MLNTVFVRTHSYAANDWSTRAKISMRLSLVSHLPPIGLFTAAAIVDSVKSGRLRKVALILIMVGLALLPFQCVASAGMIAYLPVRKDVPTKSTVRLTGLIVGTPFLLVCLIFRLTRASDFLKVATASPS
jgi:hypothetical protein